MKYLLDFFQKYNPVKLFLIKFKNLRFKRKLLMSYLIVIIIPIMILGIYSYSQSKKFLLDEAKQGLNESVRQITESLNYKFTTYNKIISFLVFNNQIIQIVNNEDSDYFQKYFNVSQILDPLVNTVLNTNNDMDKILIYTDNDNLTERTDSIISIDKINKEQWVNRVIKDRQLHWIVEDHQLSGYFRFLEPYKEAPLNLLCVKMKYDSAFDISINKVKEYGIIISDSENNILFSENTIRNNLLTDIEDKFTGLHDGEVNINGVKCILIKNTINATGWNLYYYSPISSVTIDAGGIVVATLIIISVCLGILILITLIFSNTFVKRISKLNSNMKMVEAGNLKIEVFSSAKDEIGELTNSFRNMLNKINTLIDEVYHSKIIQKEAELKALQAQINPHFLYNTLSLINWKAISIEAMEISRITTNVSKFYRTILNKGKNVISVIDEITNTKCYVEIQLALHKNSFDVEYEFEDEIFNYNMINIILQPIVENAIEHGIDQKREGRGKLSISGYIEFDNLYFKIQDNGPGIKREELDTVFLRDQGGYGLKNVQERLKIFFGEEYGISITSENGSGTCVIVKIPKYIQ